MAVRGLDWRLIDACAFFVVLPTRAFEPPGCNDILGINDASAMA